MNLEFVLNPNVIGTAFGAAAEALRSAKWILPIGFTLAGVLGTALVAFGFSNGEGLAWGQAALAICLTCLRFTQGYHRSGALWR
jgi:hypothetical protein